jgi:hypothetical protein
MKRSAIFSAAFAFAIPVVALCADDDPKQRQDLAAVIALHGKPCGEVTSYAKRGDNDFVATCKDGHRYRVYVKDGRVMVDPE